MAGREVTTTIAEYSKTAAALAVYKETFTGIKYDVLTTAGMETAKKDRRELVALRTSLEAKRKEIKEPALRRCQEIDSEAKRITAEIVALEDPIDAQIKVEENRKEAERQEKLRLAAEAQKILDENIIEISKLPLKCIGKSAEDVSLFLAALEAKVFGGEFTGETRERAERVKADVVAEIRKIHGELVEAEKAAVAEKEAARIRGIENAIEDLRLIGERAVYLSVDQLTAAMEKLEKTYIGEDFYGEFRAQAQDTKISSLQTVTDELNDKKEEEAKREKERAEIAEQQRLNAVEAERLRKLKEEEEERQKEKETAERAEKDQLAAIELEKTRQEAIAAEKKRLDAEKERKAAEKALKLEKAKCKTAGEAFKKILDIAQDNTRNETQALAEIAVIAEAMTI
jgi:colicin import membrane protein